MGIPELGLLLVQIEIQLQIRMPSILVVYY